MTRIISPKCFWATTWPHWQWTLLRWTQRSTCQYRGRATESTWRIRYRHRVPSLMPQLLARRSRRQPVHPLQRRRRLRNELRATLQETNKPTARDSQRRWNGRIGRCNALPLGRIGGVPWPVAVAVVESTRTLDSSKSRFNSWGFRLGVATMTRTIWSILAFSLLPIVLTAGGRSPRSRSFEVGARGGASFICSAKDDLGSMATWTSNTRLVCRVIKYLREPGA